MNSLSSTTSFRIRVVVRTRSEIYSCSASRVTAQRAHALPDRAAQLTALINDGIQAFLLAAGSVALAVLGFRYWTLVLASILGAA